MELVLGVPQFLLVYFVSLAGGNVLALFIHRNHSDYSAAGASGAVAGIIFAAIAVVPGIQIIFLISWLIVLFWNVVQAFLFLF